MAVWPSQAPAEEGQRGAAWAGWLLGKLCPWTQKRRSQTLPRHCPFHLREPCLGPVGGKPRYTIRALGLVPSTDTAPAAGAASVCCRLDVGPSGAGGAWRPVLGSAGSPREGSPEKPGGHCAPCGVPATWFDLPVVSPETLACLAFTVNHSQEVGPLRLPCDRVLSLGCSGHIDAWSGGDEVQVHSSVWCGSGLLALGSCPRRAVRAAHMPCSRPACCGFLQTCPAAQGDGASTATGTRVLRSTEVLQCHPAASGAIAPCPALVRQPPTPTPPSFLLRNEPVRPWLPPGEPQPA